MSCSYQLQTGVDALEIITRHTDAATVGHVQLNEQVQTWVYINTHLGNDQRCGTEKALASDLPLSASLISYHSISGTQSL